MAFVLFFPSDYSFISGKCSFCVRFCAAFLASEDCLLGNTRSMLEVPADSAHTWWGVTLTSGMFVSLVMWKWKCIRSFNRSLNLLFAALFGVAVGRLNFPRGLYWINFGAQPHRQYLVRVEEVRPMAGSACMELSHTFLSGKEVSVLCHGLLALLCWYSGLLVLQTAALKAFALKTLGILGGI